MTETTTEAPDAKPSGLTFGKDGFEWNPTPEQEAAFRDSLRQIGENLSARKRLHEAFTKAKLARDAASDRVRQDWGRLEALAARLASETPGELSPEDVTLLVYLTTERILTRRVEDIEAAVPGIGWDGCSLSIPAESMTMTFVGGRPNLGRRGR